MTGREPGRIVLFQRKTKKSADKLAEGRIKEINNGRLAMLGIMGFVSSSSVPGSVPLLSGSSIPAYEGNFWAPFQSDFTLFPAVSEVATTASLASSAVSSSSEAVSGVSEIISLL
mmetsp:Transcript_28485/g.65159  ORF Transcript_28485/g.65159 Transcript_28485/m.65159 type:complete len:115 (-) Transcript_28485:203-547(-)